MTRPLERLGIDALEAFFGRLLVSEDELLNLKEELEIRTTLRAKGLLEKVKQRLADLQKAISPPSKLPAPAATQRTYERVPVDIPVFGAQQEPANDVTDQATSKQISPVTAPAVEPAVPEASIEMSPEQAIKILKVPVTASWEQIEKSRRDLVARAQPDRLVGVPAERRKVLQDECRKVNVAYKRLLQAKT